MNFKAIKHIPNLSGYEMSEDGMHVRGIEDKVELVLDLEACKVVLVLDDGKQKAMGLRTLYHRSWNKQPTMYPESQKAKTISSRQAGKKVEGEEKPAKVKKLRAPKKSALVAHKGQLVSQLTLEEFQKLIRFRLSTDASANGIEVSDGKNASLRMVFFNQEKNIGVVRMTSNAVSKDGLWFLNPTTGANRRFITEQDKPGYGDKSIIWPEAL